jgi:membrane protease YdiL (CAAX protease family)
MSVKSIIDKCKPHVTVLTWVLALVVIAGVLLVYERHVLWKIQEQNLFLDTPLFFRQQMVLPGGILTYVGSFLMQLLYIAIMSAIGGGISQNQQNLNDLQETAGPTYKIMVAAIAPICEETIFRGMFFNLLFSHASQLNKWIGILASGFFFAFAHNPFWSPYLIVYWMMGSVLAWVYMTTKDLRYSMMTHIMWNLLSLIG